MLAYLKDNQNGTWNAVIVDDSTDPAVVCDFLIERPKTEIDSFVEQALGGRSEPIYHGPN